MSKFEEFAVLARDAKPGNDFRAAVGADRQWTPYAGSDRDASDKEDAELFAFVLNNRDHIARALRILNLIENPSYAILDDLRRAIGCETHAEPCAVLAVLAGVGK